MSYALDRLIDNARISLPGSLDSTIKLELYNVLDRFFKDTSIWTEDTTFSVNTGDDAGKVYYIEPESTSTIVRLMGVEDIGGNPVAATMQLPGEVTLVMPPGQTGTYTATVALSIIDPIRSDGYPEFPDWVLDKYGLGILDGVIGRMMAQPAKPYTNDNLAALHLKLFRSTIAIASTESSHRNVFGGQSWMYPQTFATRSRRR